MNKIRRCIECNLPHVSDSEWKNICFPCWKVSKGYEPTTGDKAYMALQSAYTELEKGGLFHEAPTPLSQAEIKDLIVLCHPDKHGGSETALRITKWLMSQRQ